MVAAGRASRWTQTLGINHASLEASPDLSSKRKPRTPQGLAMEGPGRAWVQLGGSPEWQRLLTCLGFSSGRGLAGGAGLSWWEGGTAVRPLRPLGLVNVLSGLGHQPSECGSCCPGVPGSPNPAPSPCTPHLGPTWCPQMAWLLGPTAAHLVWGRPGVHRNGEGWFGHGGWRLQVTRWRAWVSPGSCLQGLWRCAPSSEPKVPTPPRGRRIKCVHAGLCPIPLPPQGLSPDATPTLSSLSFAVQGPGGAGQQQRASWP